jgi:inhibitor of cysteine peptidase
MISEIFPPRIRGLATSLATAIVWGIGGNMPIKNRLKILWFILFFLISRIGLGVDNISFTDPSKSIIVKKSKPEFTIVLKSNPTTGFSWLLKNYDVNLMVSVENKYFSPKAEKMVGAPGYEMWTFRVKPSGFVVPQTTHITLVYARPWTEKGAKVTNFKVVTSNAN